MTHELVRSLNRTFVTPFDREDIYALASGLDDVLDYIEEIGDTVMLYRIGTIPPAATELVDLICAAVLELQKGVAKLEGLKGVEEHGIEVHRLENLGDTASRRAIGDLFSGDTGALEVIKLKEFFTLFRTPSTAVRMSPTSSRRSPSRMPDGQTALLVVAIAVALGFDFTNGFHDTANAIATTISTRALGARPAIALSAALNLAGAVVAIEVLHTKVANTIGGLVAHRAACHWP